MVTALEENQIKKFNQQLSRRIAIKRVASRHTSNQLFHEFCDNLTRLIPQIEISRLQSAAQDPPQILMGGGLRYQAIPTGHELQPFLEALAALDPGSIKIAEPIEIIMIKTNCREEPGSRGRGTEPLMGPFR
jgi:hypothetical protein